MYCWQGDDVFGFENLEGLLIGGIQVIGNYLGKVCNVSELCVDLEQVMWLILGLKWLNLYAIYLELDMLVLCDQIKLEYFKNWVEWVKVNQFGLDFNFFCFLYLLSVDGFMFLYFDDSICQFWIDYCKVSCCVLVYFGE